MTKMTKRSGKIEMLKDGPYIISGNLPFNTEAIATNAAGKSEGAGAIIEELKGCVPQKGNPRFCVGETSERIMRGLTPIFIIFR